MSDYYDGAPYGPSDATIEYRYVDDCDYSRDPEVELDWLSTWILSGTDDEVSWGDDSARRIVGQAVLEHRLDRAPTDDELDMFVDEVASEWEDGFPWTLYVGDLADRSGLDRTETNTRLRGSSEAIVTGRRVHAGAVRRARAPCHGPIKDPSRRCGQRHDQERTATTTMPKHHPAALLEHQSRRTSSRPAPWA